MVRPPVTDAAHVVRDEATRPPPDAQLKFRWAEIRALFEALLDHPRDQRTALARDSGADPAIIDGVLALLAQDATAAGDGPAAAAATVPARVGPWRPLQLLGQGGMGTVWLAERADGAYQQRVAIKFLHSALASPQFAERFERERQLLARLRHPQIAELLDGGITPTGVPYLVMAWIDGQPLTDDIAQRRPDLRTRLRLLWQLTQPVAASHRQLIVHRDIKPGNVVVTAEGLPVLLDFGIAKALDAGTDAALTQADAPMTPGYAAPEQIAGEPVSAATDVYQLGLLGLELLGGQSVPSLRTRPGGPLRTTAPSRAWAPTAGLSYPRRQLSGEIDWVIGRALEDDPARRYRDAQSLGDDLAALLEGRVVSARAVSGRYRFGKWVRRNRLAAAMLVLAVLALVGGTVAASLLALRATREAASARAAQAFLQSALEEATPRRNGGRLPDLLDLANRVYAQLETDLADQPLARADLYLSLANMYSSAGDSRRVLAASERAMALFEQHDPGSSRLQNAQMARAYGLAYADRLQEARIASDTLCLSPSPPIPHHVALHMHCVMHDFGLTRANGHLTRALAILRNSDVIGGRWFGPDYHGVRHAISIRHYRSALPFLWGEALRIRAWPLSRADAAQMLSVSLPLLVLAGEGEWAAQLVPQLAAERRALWGAESARTSAFAVEAVRMWRLLERHDQALLAAREIDIPADQLRTLDAELLVARGWAELNDGDHGVARGLFESARRTIEGRTDEIDPRLWLARAGLACLDHLEGDSAAQARMSRLLDHVAEPDYDEYQSLRRAPCPVLAAAPVARRPLPEPWTAADSAGLRTLLERAFVPALGSCPGGQRVAIGGDCPDTAVPANLR